ncbi:MAG: hypothetical protein KJP07_15965 [Desulfatitalea sp.]|nr:hypothetical protein [Desulfatitalea sp.]
MILKKICCAGAGASVEAAAFHRGLSFLDGIGFEVGHFFFIDFELTMFRRLFLITDFIKFSPSGTGIETTSIVMKDVEVSNPPKNVTIADLNGHTADVTLTKNGFSKMDIKLVIMDKMDQPHYTIEKVNVPYEGFSTGDFNVRGKLALIKTYYRIHPGQLNVDYKRE